jgi:hypothetical protein
VSRGLHLVSDTPQQRKKASAEVEEIHPEGRQLFWSPETRQSRYVTDD